MGITVKEYAEDGSVIGEVTKESPEQAAQDYYRGAIGFDSEELVPFYDPEGKPVRVRGDAVGAMLDRGGRFATDEEVVQHKTNEAMYGEEGSFRSKLSGFIRGAESGGTYGMADVAKRVAEDVLPEGIVKDTLGFVREQDRQITEREPGAVATGDFLGSAATGISTSVATGGVGGAMGIKLTGGLAQKVLASAAAGAAEGAVYGGGRALGDAALADEELGAEVALAGAAQGAAVGALIGGAFPIVGAAARRAASAASSKASAIIAKRGTAEAMEDALAKGAADAVGDAPGPTARMLGRAIHLATGADENAAAQFLSNTARGKRLRQISANADALTDNHVRSLTKSVDRFAEGAEALEDITRLGTKSKRLAAKLKNTDIQAALDAGSQWFDDLDGVAGGLKKVSKDIRAGSTPGQLSAVSARYRKAMVDAAEKGDGAGVFWALDRAKRDLGKVWKNVDKRRGILPLDDSHISAIEALYMGRQGFEEGANDLIGNVRGVREILEDATVWGEAPAEAQRRANAAWHEFLQKNKAFSKKFEGTYGTDGTVSGRPMYESDPRKLQGFLKDLGNATNVKDEQLFHEAVSLRERLASEIGELYDLTPRETSALKKLGESADAMRGTFDDAAELSDAVKLRAAAEVASQAGLANRIVLGGGRGLIATREIMDRASDGIAGRVNRAKNAVLKRAKGLPSGAQTRAAVRETARIATASGPILAAAYARSRKILEQEPEAPNTVANESPGHAAAMVAKQQQILAYLAERDPEASAAPKTPYGAKRRVLVSEGEQRRFVETVEAARNPMGVIDDVARGVVRPVAVRTVRDLYPRLYQDLSNAVAEGLAELKEPPPYSSRVEIGTLFDIVSDPSLHPQNLARMQTTYAPDQGEEAAPPGAQTGPPQGQQTKSVKVDTPSRLHGSAALENRRASQGY